MFNNKFFGNRIERSNSYSCPRCRKGNIYELNLMEEVLACNRCEHLFTLNFETQTIESLDSQTPISWHWNGKRWQRIKPPNKSEPIYSGLFC
jgi:acetyl-CoA carboxylase beta subunit